MGVIELVAAYPISAIAVSILTYTVLLYVYRLTLHPLARFPGSTLAATSLWYEFYHDFFRDGRYIFVIRDMHRQHGPIVRISPDELHVDDPTFIAELMPAGGRRRNKYSRMMQVFGFAEAAGATVEHDLHRTRRGAMAKMFSKESVRRLEPIMRGNLDKLFGRFRQARETGTTLDLLAVFGAFTNDLISEYAYGFNANWLQAENFNQQFFDMIDGFHEFGALAVQFSWFMPLMNAIPQWLLFRLNPGMLSFVKFKQDLMRNIEIVAQSRKQGKETKTVFDEIFDSRLSDFEKRPSRLLEEAQNISIAGTETTSWTLSVMTFYLLATPHALNKLRAELKSAIPNPDEHATIKQVEKLPYLNAVILEGLRISMGTSNRQTRINPDGVMVYDDGKRRWEIPAGTPVGMATPLVHLNPALFRDPLTFSPERFLNDPGLKRHLMPFSHGSRQCLGMQLAWSEMYLVVSGIWRRFGGPSDAACEKSGLQEQLDGFFELYGTDASDVEMVADKFVPYPKKESQGVRIRVRA